MGTAAIVASIIMSVLMATDQSLGLALGSKRQKQLQQQASKIAKEITKDQELLNNLLDAYNRKDNQLQNDILMSSPFGSRLRNLRENYNLNKNAIKETKDRLGALNTKQSSLTNDLNTELTKSQTSGSIISDLISGSARQPSSSFAETHKYNSQATELQNKLKGVK